LHDFSFRLSLYVLLVLLTLNGGLYVAYYSTAPNWVGEHPDYVFLYRLVDPSFPLYGLWFAFVPAITGFFLVLIFLQKIKTVIMRSTLSALSLIVSFMFSLTFMPFSLTLGFSYLGLIGVVFTIIFVKGILLEPIKHSHVDEVIEKRNKLSAREAFKLRHSTLLSLLRDSIWASITFTMATLSGLLLYQLNSLSVGGSLAVYYIFWRWQTLLLLILLLYYLLGFTLGISLPILRAAQEIEEKMEKI